MRWVVRNAANPQALRIAKSSGRMEVFGRRARPYTRDPTGYWLNIVTSSLAFARSLFAVGLVGGS